MIRGLFEKVDVNALLFAEPVVVGDSVMAWAGERLSAGIGEFGAVQYRKAKLLDCTMICSHMLII